MTWRTLIAAVLAALLLQPADSPAAEASIEYVPLDAPAGMSQAVVVQGHPLVHTRQLFPLDAEGKLVGKGSADEQVEQVLDNLDAVLKNSGSSLNQLVRVNVYAIEPSTVDRLREQLARRLDAAVRPAMTSVLTPLAARDALVAVDAVAAAADQGPSVVLQQCETVAGDKDYADAAVLPRGGVAYLSGVPAAGGLTRSAIDESVAGLLKMLEALDLEPAHVVRLKVFLRPASAAEEVRRELKKHFPDQLLPPVECALVAQLPAASGPAPSVEYYNPPDVRLSQLFSRAALVRGKRQIYISSLFVPKPTGRKMEAALSVFDQLEAILEKTGSDLAHMAKGTYYVSDTGAASGMDRVRLWRYDAGRAPAASKCMVHGMGKARRTMTLDMIAVGVDR